MKKARVLLRVLRAQQEPKLTQSAVARRAGLSRSRYWQIEVGEGSEPSSGEREAVAAALGVKVSEIAWPEVARAKAS